MGRSRVFGSDAELATLEVEMNSVISKLKKFSNDTRYMRDELRAILVEAGWVPDFRLGDSNLRIGYKRGDAGLCIQFGNVSRFHSDLLKLAFLQKNNSITHAVIVVPSDEFSKFLGSNHAAYTKCERDLGLLGEVLEMPILLMEVDGDI